MKASLGEIRDVRGYVATIVRRRFARHCDEDGSADIIAQGVLVMYELHDQWQHLVVVHGGNFEGFQHFCNRELPSKLLQWWRDEMRQRGIKYRQKAGGYRDLGRQSVEALVEQADAVDGMPPSDYGHSELPLYHEPAFA